jgi:hypothetical protein
LLIWPAVVLATVAQINKSFFASFFAKKEVLPASLPVSRSPTVNEFNDMSPADWGGVS